MISARFSFRNERGKLIDCVSYTPEFPPRAIIFVVHGYGDHIDRIMTELAPEEWVAKGVAVYGYSHQGHGRSEGVRVHIDAFGDFVDDLAMFVLDTRDQYGKSCPPCFLFGESMGGAIAILATNKGGPLHNVIAGNILVAPMCKLSDDIILSDWMIGLMKCIMLVAPMWRIVPTADLCALCFKDPRYIEASKCDPLTNKDKPRVRMAWECLAATERISTTLHKVDIPFLVLHGGADRMTDCSASVDLYKCASSNDKSLIVYEGMWHCILCEPDGGAEMVRADIHTWVDAHIH